MVLMEQGSRLIGIVSKETEGKLWGRGSIWEINGEPRFLCNTCSKKILNHLKKKFRNIVERLHDEELEVLYEQIKTDRINPLQVPEKYKNEIYVEEPDWTYRLVQDGVIKCENCGEIVI